MNIQPVILEHAAARLSPIRLIHPLAGYDSLGLIGRMAFGIAPGTIVPTKNVMITTS